MTKTVLPDYCGNSPKIQRIADFNLAFASADVTKALSFLHEDVQWDMLGEQTIQGHQAVKDFIEENAKLSVLSWELQDVLSHGKLGSASGMVQLEQETIYFADFYEFASAAATAKIKKIKTLAISKKTKIK